MKNSKSLKSSSNQNIHHKSVHLVIETSESPPKKRSQSPSMNALETERLINRLTETSHSRIDDYSCELSKKQKELRSKCERLYATIDLFKLMDSNNMALRCMQHNNALTLYCLSQRKILCVNCTYGQMKHRTHKVLPLKDSAKYIHQDNEQLTKILKEDFKVLQGSIKNSKENVTALNSGQIATLRKMEEDFIEKKKTMEMKYEQSVKLVKQKFQDLIRKSQNIEKQIQDFKFKVYECLSRVGLGRNTELTIGDMPVIKQVISSAFTELTKFQFKKITQRQIQRLINFPNFDFCH